MLAPARSRCRFEGWVGIEGQATWVGPGEWGNGEGLASDELGVHPGVDALVGYEAFVGAAFHDAAVVEH